MSGICRKLKEKLVAIYNKLFVIKFKIAVLGLEGCGKSAAVENMFYRDLNYIGRQKDAQVYEYDEDNIHYIIYDVSGKRTSRVKWDYFYRKCDVLLYCVDTSWDEDKWEKAREELKSMLYRNVWMKRNMLILGTKNDRKNTKSCKDIILNLDLLTITDREISCFSISSRNNTNIEYIRPWLVDQCKFLREKSRFKVFKG